MQSAVPRDGMIGAGGAGCDGRECRWLARAGWQLAVGLEDAGTGGGVAGTICAGRSGRGSWTPREAQTIVRSDGGVEDGEGVCEHCPRAGVVCEEEAVIPQELQEDGGN